MARSAGDLPHPVELNSGLPVVVLRALAKYLWATPAEIVASRSASIQQLLAWKRDPGIPSVNADARISDILAAKDLTLWKKALIESSFCEPHLVDDVAAGFELAGTATYSPQFPFEVRLARYSPEILKSSSVWRSRASFS
eukprot:1351950-Amphidinium_carterae.1